MIGITYNTLEQNITVPIQMRYKVKLQGVGNMLIGVNLSSNAYPANVLPPLIPFWKGGKRNPVPSPLQGEG